MALVGLKNAGLVDPSQIDESATKAILLASERLPKGLFKDIYEISYSTKDGKRRFTVVTMNKSSYEECSMSDVTTLIVSRELK